jgi:hypothetical protein
VVCDQFLVVFPGFLETKYEDYKLLTPVRSLHEIIALEFRRHLPVRIVYDSSRGRVA